LIALCVASVPTSDAFMIGMLGLLAACTAKLGVAAMFNLYFMPCECLGCLAAAATASATGLHLCACWLGGCWLYGPKIINEVKIKLTSDAFMISMLGLLAACTAKLGVAAMFNLYFMPCEYLMPCDRFASVRYVCGSSSGVTAVGLWLCGVWASVAFDQRRLHDRHAGPAGCMHRQAGRCRDVQPVLHAM
jgi:hypothetical protein